MTPFIKAWQFNDYKIQIFLIRFVNRKIFSTVFLDMNYGKVPPDHKNFQIFANLFYNLLVKKNVASILDRQLIFLIPTLKGLMSLYS